MNKKIGIIVGTIIVALIAGGSFLRPSSTTAIESEEDKITVTHRNGETEVKKNPKNVVVLDYGSADILDAIDVEITAIAKSNLPAYLNMYDDEKYIDIGGLKEFDIEKINEVKPELIIIEDRQLDYYEELSQIAPTILLGTNDANHYESVKKNADILGDIFDKEEEADSLIGDLDNRIIKVSEKVKEQNLNALALMVTDGSMSVYGEGSRFGMIYNEFAFEATDKNIEVSRHGQNISYEYLMSKNPQYLFVIDKAEATSKLADNTGARDVLKNEIVEKTDAYKNNNIIYLNSPAWYVGGAGITATDLMLNDIENAIGI